MLHRTSIALRRAACAALAVAGFAPVASAAPITWTGLDGDQNWATPGNWDAGTPTGADDATLPTPIPPNGGTINVAGGSVANSLTINDAYTLNGGDLTLTSGNVTVAASTTAVINSALGGTLNKLGAGTLTVGSTTSTLTATNVNGGTLALGADNALPVGSTLVIGTGGTAGHLNMGAFNQSLSSLTFRTTSTATANTVTIAPDKKLTITGTDAIKLGIIPFTTNTTTNATFTGGGALEVNNTGATMDVGIRNNDQNAPTSNSATLDLTALSSVLINVGTLNVGFESKSKGVLNLSNTDNDITATTIRVGDSAANNGASGNQMVLGTGVNEIRADSLRIGVGKIDGILKFASQAAGSSGGLLLRNKAGTGGANMVIGSNEGTGTSASFTGTVDLRGHSVDARAGTVTLGRRNETTNTGSATGIIWFDAGTFTATTINAGLRSSTGTGNATGTINVGGGTFTVTNLNLGDKSGTGSLANNATTATGTLNLTNGNVVIATGGSFKLATRSTGASDAGTAAGTVNITGGTLTSNAALTDGGGPNSNSTLTLNGGTLDMTNKAIGSAANPITTVNLRAGTLRNVGEINGGGAISKTTAGTLVFDGTLAYSGPLTIAEGVLDVNGAGGLGATGSTSTITVEDLGQLALDAAAIPDGIGLGINSNGMGPVAEVVLNFTGTDTLSTLTINGIDIGPGEYGASGTNAANNADLVALGINPDDVFSGTGTLTTTSAVPEPGALAVVAVAGLGMMRRRRRV
ncbi:MAG TPA: hypothetical protein VEA69_02355 [Tepidisphaeraceae bacterium]|nr:hypothetical protein [Tepidisphaeraceae bacterium]